MSIRFGLVGAGGIGKIRADALKLSRDCSLVAVADPDQDRARALAALGLLEAEAETAMRLTLGGQMLTLRRTTGAQT